MSPPRIAQAIVEVSAPPGDLESVSGDLHEEYVRMRVREGQARADAWYWSQALRSAPSLLAYSRVPRSFGALAATLLLVLSGIVVLLLLNEFIDDAIRTVYRPAHASGSWPFFAAGCFLAAACGAAISALRRSYGLRLVLISACGLLAFIAIPILLHISSRLTGATWILILSAALSMCIGGAACNLKKLN